MGVLFKFFWIIRIGHVFYPLCVFVFGANRWPVDIRIAGFLEQRFSQFNTWAGRIVTVDDCKVNVWARTW